MIDATSIYFVGGIYRNFYRCNYFQRWRRRLEMGKRGKRIKKKNRKQKELREINEQKTKKVSVQNGISGVHSNKSRL
nr:MAG TPA: hypothetical protein [Caudoviricetes sp.]